MIKYKCEECGSSLTIKNELAGTAGKCPKCKTPFRVPEPDEAPKKKSKKSAAASAAPPKEVSEEDMIFGEDFFSMDESPARRPTPVATFVPPDEPPPKKKKAEKKPPGTEGADGDNSAQVASALLSKTGKKNRPSNYDDIGEEEGEGGYDFSAITYLILWRIVPVVLGLGLMVPGFYWFFNAMLFSSFELPPLVEVHGKVLIDGAPAVNAQLLFIPALDRKDPTPGGGSAATTSNDGSYIAMYKQDTPGAIIGKHTVRLTVNGRNLTTEITVAEGDGETEKNIEFKTQ